MKVRWLACLAAVSCVAACGETVTVYDTPDGSPWAPMGPRWQVPAGGVALITNSLGNSVAVLDLAAGTVMGTYPVGVTPLTENGPHHLGLSAPESAVLIPLSFPPPALLPGPHAAHGSSVLPGILVKRSLDDFRLLGTAQLDPNPGELILSPDGTRAYVSHFDLARALANPGMRARQVSNLIVVNTHTMATVATVPLCVAAHGMVVSPDGNTLYAACYADDAIAVIDLRPALPTVTTVPLGEALTMDRQPSYGPYSMSRTPDGSTVWTGTSASMSQVLFAFNTATNTFDMTRTLRRLGGYPMFPGYSPDGTTMVVPLQNRDGVLRVRFAASGPELLPAPIQADDCILPHAASFGPDGRVYVVCEGRHSASRTENGRVLALDPETMTIAARFEVGPYPDAIVFLAGAR